MEFRYYYRTNDYKVMRDEIAHIKSFPGKSEVFLCGAKKWEGEFIQESYALSGRKLCDECVRERERVLDRRPTLEQLQNWWNGGMDAHRKEMEALK